jgi:hypothetical protein
MVASKFVNQAKPEPAPLDTLYNWERMVPCGLDFFDL